MIEGGYKGRQPRSGLASGPREDRGTLELEAPNLVIDDENIEWEKHGTFALPDRAVHELLNDSSSDEAILFSFTGDSAMLKPRSQVRDVWRDIAWSQKPGCIFPYLRRSRQEGNGK